MKKFKKAIRLFALILLVLISSFGLVTIFPNYRERYLHKETRMEQVAKNATKKKPRMKWNDQG